MIAAILIVLPPKPLSISFILGSVTIEPLTSSTVTSAVTRASRTGLSPWVSLAKTASGLLSSTTSVFSMLVHEERRRRPLDATSDGLERTRTTLSRV